jgi:hypothetical protein
MPTRDDFFDVQDGYVDVSRFLDRDFGFIPVVMPITEPAVGYGAAAALLFVSRRGEPGSEEYRRPNLAAIGGLRTENGTRGAAVGGSGRWLDGRLQLDGGVADADINLDLYTAGGVPLGYSASARGGVVGGKYRLGETPWWTGLRYFYGDVDVRFDPDGGEPPPLARDRSLRLAVLSPTITYDSRDNLFTPECGLFFDATWSIADNAFGSDRDFQRVDVIGLAFHPAGNEVFLGAKLAARWSSDETPFYLRPFVQLRGV